MKAPIFLLGCHRSGTSLLRSLFDGHPELNVVPIESHYFEHGGHWVEYPLRYQRKEPDRGLEGFIDSAMSSLEAYNRSGNSRRDVDAEGAIEPERFRKAMEQAPEKDGAARMEHYFRALLEAAGEEPKEGGIWVEKSVEHFEFLPLLKRYFPEARFIHILRNPYANMVSLRNFRSRRGNFPFLPPLIRTLQWHRYHFLRWQEWADAHFTVRYEELLSDPETVMRDLAGKLGLEFTPSLLEPSFLGKDWGGNRASGEKLRGLSAQRTEAWKEEIAPVEHRLVNRGLGWMIEASGYEQHPAPKGYWKRRKGEALRTYLSNRLYKNYLGRSD